MQQRSTSLIEVRAHLDQLPILAQRGLRAKGAEAADGALLFLV